MLIKPGQELDKYQNYWFEGIYLGSEIFGSGYQYRRLEAVLGSGNMEQVKATSSEMEGNLAAFFKDYDPIVDKEVFVALMTLYKQKVGKEYLPSFFETIENEFGRDIQKYADKLYSTSILTDQSRAESFLKDPDLQILQNDLGYQSINCITGHIFQVVGSVKNP